MIRLKFICFITFLITINCVAQNATFNKTLDSIQKLIKLSKNESFTTNDRLKYAQKASRLSYSTKLDSTILKSNMALALCYLITGNKEAHLNQHQNNIKIALKLKDTFTTGLIYGNIGWNYHSGQKHLDSAYYYYNKSLKAYTSIKNKWSEAEVLINIAQIQSDERNYTQSEINLIKAVNLLKEIKNNSPHKIDDLYQTYNSLGIVNRRLKNYKQASLYYNKALEFNSQLTNNRIVDSNGNIINKTLNFIVTKSNIAELYKETKNYQESILINQKLLGIKKLFKDDPITYAIISNNLAHTLLLANNPNKLKILSNFKTAYQISDSLKYDQYTSAIGNGISEYYLSQNQNDSAIYYLEKSYELATNSNLEEEILKTLLLFSKAYKGEIGKEYLEEYIKLNDSLIDNERNMRNKFARIEFETNEIIAENKEIIKDKNQLHFLAILFLIISLLIYIIYSQRLKNKQLAFESQQQKANESIYSLMLEQHNKLEEGRIIERERISAELHDGILSKLFGIRVSFGFLFMKIKNDEKLVQSFIENNKNLQSVEQEIRDLSHELKNKVLTTKTDFHEIINDYVSNLSDLNLFSYNLTSDDDIHWNDISDKLKISLYRILQEALLNIAKHSEATNVDITFQEHGQNIMLSIKDNGIGFNTKKKVEGIGIKNMKSRTKNIDGVFKIKSQYNLGTEIAITIPLKA